MQGALGAHPGPLPTAFVVSLLPHGLGQSAPRKAASERACMEKADGTGTGGPRPPGPVSAVPHRLWGVTVNLTTHTS